MSTLDRSDRETRLRRWSIALMPGLLGAAWILWLFGPLLSPGRALANRDIAIFHLPLRANFKDLAALGAPVWNPWLHGGQPILSNPSYGAFYPPSWLVFASSPAYALSLMALFHAAVAFAGAWKLARHFGCGGGAAALAAVGYTGCGAYFSLLSVYNLFCSMAWFPWVLAWGDESLRVPAGERWWRPALLAGGALGLQLLSGEPSPVIMTSLVLVALAASAAARRVAAAPRVLAPFLFAVALAAVQLFPTLDRLADSQRKTLPPEIAHLWSMPPQRLIEAVFPRIVGDPARAPENLFFGWKAGDVHYPFIESLYPGLALLVLGVSALLVWRIPRRAVWILCFAGGCFLAIGRYNPLYEGLRKAVPVLAVFRYPERFIIVSVLAIVIAGVLGWQRLLDERDSGRRSGVDLPLALSLAILAAALVLTALLFWVPEACLWLISSHGSPDLPAASRATALEYLRTEGCAAAATAAAVAALFALCRWRRPSRRLLERLAVVLVAADLWHYGHLLVRTVPSEVYRHPPPLAAALETARDRVYVQVALTGQPLLLHQRGDLPSLETRVDLFILEPYSSALWHIPSAFDYDFELFLTGWAQRANDILRAETDGSESQYRYLGAWNVRTFLLHKTLQEQIAALRDPAASPRRTLTNIHVLPRFRFVPRVSFHPDHPGALAAARAGGWRVARNEHCVRPGRPPQTISYTRPPRLLGITDQGGRIDFRYHAEEGAFFIAAMTFDRGWRASLDGQPLETYATAACQLGVRLPAGEHRLLLQYRQPLFIPGAVVSLLALTAGAALVLSQRRRRLAAGDRTIG